MDDAPTPTPRPAAVRAAKCVICQCPLRRGEQLVRCPSCGSVYHADCWEDNRGCGVYGCPAVPETEHREAIETPVSYWGQERKPCPSCNAEILAAATRCRHCGATFESARPEDRREFASRQELRSRLPKLRQQVVWFFVCCLIPCFAPFAATLGAAWFVRRRKELAELPGLHAALAKIGLGVAIGQTAFGMVVVLLYSGLHAG